MASELSLTWDEHQSTLVGVFEKLLTAGALVDCTIAAEGQYIKAHKIILSACSPYFEMLFTEEKEKNPIVVLKDIKFQELKAMIDFIYRGKVKVPEERLGDFVDAAESLQIKGLGVSNRNINSPEQSGNESSAVMRKKEGRVSPLPRKRSRRSYANNNGDNVRGISPVVDITIENPEELRSPMDIPSSSRSDPSPPLVSARDSPSLLPSSECSEQKNLDSSDSLPFVESALPTSEQLPNPETVVVKNEPEPMAEVFIPEIECFIEPKSEDVGLQESMLDCGSGEMEPAAGDNQHSSSQYSAFSTALQASSSSTGRSDNLLLMTDVVDSFNTQGAALQLSEVEHLPDRRRLVQHSPTIASLGGIPRFNKEQETEAYRLPTAAPIDASSPCRRSSSNRGRRPGRPVKQACLACGKTFEEHVNLSHDFMMFSDGRRYPWAVSSLAEDEVQFCGSALSQTAPLADLAGMAGPSMALKMDIDALPASLDAKYNPRPVVAAALHPLPKHECRVCRRVFPSAGPLEVHMRKHRLQRLEMHAGPSGSGTLDTPYKCDMCHRVFLRASELAVHRRLHTGEKLYQCDKCDVASAYSSDLLRHKRVMHGYPPTRRRGGGRGSRRGV